MGKVVAHHEIGWGRPRALNQRVDTNDDFPLGLDYQDADGDRGDADGRAGAPQARRARVSTDFIPELRRVHSDWGTTDSITVQMLLSHASGLQGVTWPWTTGAPWEPFEPTTWEQLVAMMPYQRLAFKPGTLYSYSNPGSRLYPCANSGAAHGRPSGKRTSRKTSSRCSASRAATSTRRRGIPSRTDRIILRRARLRLARGPREGERAVNSIRGSRCRTAGGTRRWVILRRMWRF